MEETEQAVEHHRRYPLMQPPAAPPLRGGQRSELPGSQRLSAAPLPSRRGSGADGPSFPQSAPIAGGPALMGPGDAPLSLRGRRLGVHPDLPYEYRLGAEPGKFVAAVGVAGGIAYAAFGVFICVVAIAGGGEVPIWHDLLGLTFYLAFFVAPGTAIAVVVPRGARRRIVFFPGEVEVAGLRTRRVVSAAEVGGFATARSPLTACPGIRVRFASGQRRWIFHSGGTPAMIHALNDRLADAQRQPVE